MIIKTENGPAVPIDLTPSSVTVPTAVTSSGVTVVATPMNQEPLEFNYDPTTPSGEIVTDSLKRSGMNLEPVYFEEVTETFERSRGLLAGGFKFAFSLPEKFGGGSLRFERTPQSETKTTTKTVYKPPKS